MIKICKVLRSVCYRVVTKKTSKSKQCSSVANYRTAMIFFLQSSQEFEVFFDGNFFCQKFVCLPFFCPFSPLEGPKRAKKHPQVRVLPSNFFSKDVQRKLNFVDLGVFWALFGPSRGEKWQKKGKQTNS